MVNSECVKGTGFKVFKVAGSGFGLPSHLVSKAASGFRTCASFLEGVQARAPALE